MVIKNLLFFVLFLSGFGYSQDFGDKIKLSEYKFGEIKVNNTLFEKDIVIDGNKVIKRKKGPSKGLKAKYGHTPLTKLEYIPWDCDTLLIGTGAYERLPITNDFKKEAKQKGVTLIILSTKKAVKFYNKNSKNNINAILHLTC